ncbi:MAG: MFS transporter, partial [Bacteroidetes bacterium]|nr:MFS transporter [Bacteroidota bacterium]
GVISIVYTTAVVFMILFYIIPIQLPFQLKEIGVEKHSLAGIALAINAVGAVIGSLLYSRVKQKIDFAAVFSVGFLIMAIGYLVSGITANFSIIMIAMFIAGLGFGSILPNMNLWVIQLTKAEVRGRNMGILTTSIFLGQFLSPLVVEPFTLIMDLSMVFSLAGGIMLLVSLTFILINNSKWITNPDHYQNYSDHP